MESMRIRNIRKSKKMSGTVIAKELGISAQHYYDIEKGENGLSSENAVKLAEIFEVTLDYLLGRSISALIEDRLLELGKSMKDLSDETELPVQLLNGIDTLPPQPWDYEKGEIIDKIAKALNMDHKVLASAFALQEPPVYDGPQISVEEAFANENYNEPQTIAAHFDGNEYTPEELEEIREYAKYLKSKRKG